MSINLDGPDPIPDDLRDQLGQINKRQEGPERKLRSFLTSGDGQRSMDRIWTVTMGGPDLDSEALQAGAHSFVNLLDRHPMAHSEQDVNVAHAMFPDQPGYTESRGTDIGRLAALGSMMLGLAGRTSPADFDRLWNVIAGADHFSETLRNVFLGKLLESSPQNTPDDIFNAASEFARRNCFLGVRAAQAQLALAFMSLQSTSYATGIERLEPPQGCGGERVTIYGSGFGNSQPELVGVLFPTSSGGCKSARVISWSNTAIEVDVPEDVGNGCVGFVEHTGGGGGSITEGISLFVGEVTNCLGPLAAERIRQAYENFPLGALQPPCSPCLPLNENHFLGGKPTIRMFSARRYHDEKDDQSTLEQRYWERKRQELLWQTQTPSEQEKEDFRRVNGIAPPDVSTMVSVAPMQDIIEVSWDVENATWAQIVPVVVNDQINELPTVLGVFNPLHDEVLIRWPQPGGSPNALTYLLTVGSFTWVGAFELRAINSCGTTVASVTVRMRMPESQPTPVGGFYWGVATAGRQVEGNLTNDDWYIFTTDPRILDNLQILKSLGAKDIAPEDAKIALNNWTLAVFTEEVERAHALGLNAYRLSIEWSRIEPIKGVYDGLALSNYQAMIDTIRAHDMEPFVVLNHLSLPAWVLTPPTNKLFAGPTGAGRPSGKTWTGSNDPDFTASLQGWESTDTVDAYLRYVQYVVARLHSVRYWLTFNEPLGTTVITGYIVGVFPPGFLGHGDRAKAVVHNFITAHARAYEAIKAIDPVAQVGITDQWLQCKPNLNATVTEQFAYYNQDLLINALVRGDEDRAIDLKNPQYERVLGIPEATWKPHLDFFGLQYYKSVHPNTNALISLFASFLGGAPDLDQASVAGHALLNDMHWEMSPQGLYDAIMKLGKISSYKGNTLPILIAENGTAEIEDHNRAAFITGHVQQLERAIDDGANVFGYLHWTIADNWEWIDGYRPAAHFGLFSVDNSNRNNPAKTHAITEGALALSYIMKTPNRAVAPAVSAYGRYQPDGFMMDPPIRSAFATFEGLVDKQPVTLLLGNPAGIASYPNRSIGLMGMLFYRDICRWVRLRDVTWDPIYRILQFFHPTFALPQRVQESIYAGKLDFNGVDLDGTVTEVAGNTVLPHAWTMKRQTMVGMWRWMNNGTPIGTLSLSCPEGIWHARILPLQPSAPLFDWIVVPGFSVQPNGFTAMWGAQKITGQVNGNAMTITTDTPTGTQPYGLLDRLPDGLPF
jgi:beta-glucosidase